MSECSKTGTIIKGIGGFYYVETADGIFECRARGIFRREKVTPLVGDRVTITVHEGENENTVDAIAPRRNQLRRPPVSNIDQLVIVVSSCEPKPNLLLTDRMTCIAIKSGIEPVIVLNKTDLKDVTELAETYSKAGFTTIETNGQTGQGTEQLRASLEGKISAFTGNSGVGKSSLLNQIDPSFALQTAAISQKLGRGKHTTRECVLLKTCGGYVADTPGFASFELQKNEAVQKEDLPELFPEFRPFLGQCKFSPSCTHTGDLGCAIVQAVKDGVIGQSRYDSYLTLYGELKNMNAWDKS